ncbi:hypothetical protein [Paenibacillus kobensis]|nr:hypothetical protein [Paenibacillus kobensis]
MSDPKIRTEKPRRYHWLERSWYDVLAELIEVGVRLLIRAIGKLFHHLD